MASVKLTKFIEAMGFENLTPDIDVSGIRINISEINRPALQLTGYFEHFDKDRVQIIGYVEYTYLQNIPMERKIEIYKQYLSYEIPCTIFCSLSKPDQEFIDLANEYGRPVYYTERKTSDVMASVIHWLNRALAPCISIHGVLVDVYGEGILIMGESGIGKSEAALELIKRGHRLVSDDVVEIRKVSDETLIGSAPDITRHFIELRGIGIIDVKTLFGVSSVMDTTNINLVIRLEDWDKEKKYDRLGDCRCRTNQCLITDFADLYHVIAYQTMAALYKLQSCLTLTNAALAHQKHTFTEYIHQYTVDADTRSQFRLQPADHLRHYVGSRLGRKQTRHTIMAAKCQNLFFRFHIAAEHDTRNLAGDQLIIHLHSSFLGKSGHICHLHITHDLHTLIIKMIIKACQLQCRSVHIRMRDHNLIRIQFRCQVLKIHFLNNICNRNSVHPILLSGKRCLWCFCNRPYLDLS